MSIAIAADVAISVNGVKKYFKDVKAVNGVELQIQKGEYVALLGPNGAGKTTLVEMIEGIQKPDEGEILINGLNWKGNEDRLHRLIGLSLQETKFIDKLRVSETLSLFASFYGLSDDSIEEICRLVGLDQKMKSYTVNLSGGQRQKLALGIALLNDPKILLLDEPTTGLDPTARREIWDILMKLKEERQTTMILTTHYMEEADYLCDRIVIMDQGVVLARGTKEELLKQFKKGEVIEFGLGQGGDQQLIERIAQPYKVKWSGFDGKIVVDDIVTFLPKFLEEIQKQHFNLSSLECRKMTLDDLFLSMTGRSLSE